MYFHAQQFPHLAGKNYDEIRQIARRAMSRRPHLRNIMRLRNLVVMGACVAALVGMSRYTHLQTGMIMMIVGGILTVFLLLWNLLWLNTVLFRITREEVSLSNDG